MRAGVGAIRNAVVVDIEIPSEILAGVELRGGHHLAAVHPARVVPGKGFRQPILHPDIEIEHDEDRRLQTIRQVERERAEFEAFARILRHQQYVLRVTVGRIRA